jgi:hypothetical protein
MEKDRYGEYGWASLDSEIDAHKIEIKVESGALVSYVYVRIVLNPNEVEFTATLQQKPVSEPNVATSWQPTKSIQISQLDGRHTPTVEYRVLLKFSIHGEVLYDTSRQRDYSYFSVKELYHDYGSSEPLNPNGGWDDTLVLYSEEFYQIFRNEGADMQLEPCKIIYQFRVKGTDYFTKSNLIITLTE